MIARTMVRLDASALAFRDNGFLLCDNGLRRPVFLIRYREVLHFLHRSLLLTRHPIVCFSRAIRNRLAHPTKDRRIGPILFGWLRIR